MPRRRRKKFIWFPNLGTDSPGTVEWSGRAGDIDVPVDGTQDILIIPLTLDQAIDQPVQPDQTLADVLGSEYIIERIVGKFTCENIAGQPDDDPQQQWGVNKAAAVRVTAGLFVARADNDDVDVPIGATLVTTEGLNEALASYNPSALTSIREPWMWRRSWVLANASFWLGIEPATGTIPGGPGSSNIGLEGATYPPTTVYAQPGVNDGPHVDVKSVRRIAQDERLWLAVSVVNYPIGLVLQTPTQISTIRFEFDYRILGALRKARTRGAF